MTKRPIQTSRPRVTPVATPSATPVATPSATLHDPALKAAVRQLWGNHRASDQLRADIEQRLREATAKNPS